MGRFFGNLEVLCLAAIIAVGIAFLATFAMAMTAQLTSCP